MYTHRHRHAVARHRASAYNPDLARYQLLVRNEIQGLTV